MPIYLDNNATTHLDSRVAEAMRPYLEGPYANPSSLHRFGRAARDAVEAARAQVASLVGARSSQVIFTSGGTEADNLAIQGICAQAVDDARVLYGSTEHPAVLETCEALAARGRPAATIAVGEDGLVDWGQLQSQLESAPACLVALMLANNETGVIQDIARATELAHEFGARILTDAVQAAGKIPVDFEALGVDLLTLSSHKLYGPRGAGALICRSEVEIAPLLHGGGQENGLRGGTENVAAIVGFGVAAELAEQEMATRTEHVQALRQRLQDGIDALPGARIFAASSPRVPNTVQFAIPGWEGEALLMALDRKGFAVSSGSACSSGRGEPSHVLLAMHVPRDVAYGAVRVSLGKNNSASEVDALLSAMAELRSVGAAP